MQTLDLFWADASSGCRSLELCVYIRTYIHTVHASVQFGRLSMSIDKLHSITPCTPCQKDG